MCEIARCKMGNQMFMSGGRVLAGGGLANCRKFFPEIRRKNNINTKRNEKNGRSNPKEFEVFFLLLSF